MKKNTVCFNYNIGKNGDCLIEMQSIWKKIWKNDNYQKSVQIKWYGLVNLQNLENIILLRRSGAMLISRNLRKVLIWSHAVKHRMHASAI